MNKSINFLLIVLHCMCVEIVVKPAVSATTENLQSTNISSKVATFCSEARRVHISDISGDGSVVVGHCIKSIEPWDQPVFLYSQSSGVKDLGTLGKKSIDNVHISADGLVIWGTFYIKDEGSHIFRYTEAEGLQDLGTMGKSGMSVKGVSANGLVIVGHFYNSSTERPLVYHAFRYSQLLGFEDLSYISKESTHPQGVSADGSLIVGSIDIGANSKSSIRFISPHAFQYSHLNGMRDIGMMGDATRATGISNDGSVIVGTGAIYHTIGGIAEISHESFVFVYTEKGSMQRMGALNGKSVGVAKISANGARIMGSYSDKNGESYVYTAKLVNQAELTTSQENNSKVIHGQDRQAVDKDRTKLQCSDVLRDPVAELGFRLRVARQKYDNFAQYSDSIKNTENASLLKILASEFDEKQKADSFTCEDLNNLLKQIRDLEKSIEANWSVHKK